MIEIINEYSSLFFTVTKIQATMINRLIKDVISLIKEVFLQIDAYVYNTVVIVYKDRTISVGHIDVDKIEGDFVVSYEYSVTNYQIPVVIPRLFDVNLLPNDISDFKLSVMNIVETHYDIMVIPNNIVKYDGTIKLHEIKNLRRVTSPDNNDSFKIFASHSLLLAYQSRFERESYYDNIVNLILDKIMFHNSKVKMGQDGSNNNNVYNTIANRRSHIHNINAIINTIKNGYIDEDVIILFTDTMSNRLIDCIDNNYSVVDIIHCGNKMINFYTGGRICVLGFIGKIDIREHL